MRANISLKAFIQKYQEKNVHIIGFSGAEGAAVTKMLHHFQFSKLTLHDSASEKRLFSRYQTSHKEETAEEQRQSFQFLTTLPYTYYYEQEYLKGIEKADLIVLPQAWYIYTANAKIRPLLKKIDSIGMMEMYLSFSPCRTIGITGTNGKSTTARLLHEMFEYAEIPHYFAGNDRLNRQVLDKLEVMKKEEYFLLEISNRQLLQLNTSPHIAIFTTITPDHLDEHRSFEQYIEVKKKLICYQSHDDSVILNEDDPLIKEFAEAASGKVYGYSIKGKLPEKREGIEVEEGYAYLKKEGKREKLFHTDVIALKGEHNLANALAATLSALLEGITLSSILEVLQNTKGLRYRNQFVKKINGIDYYNDLNSTVPEATIAAIRSFSEKHSLFVILGGADKGLNYTPLAEELVKPHLFPLLLPGTGTDKIVQASENFPELKKKLLFFKTLNEVVLYCDRKGKEGDTVLLSPACAYFFSRYTNLVTDGDESWLNVLTVSSR